MGADQRKGSIAMALKENWFEKDALESKTTISAKRLLEPLSEPSGQSLFRADLEGTPQIILRQSQDKPKTNLRQFQKNIILDEHDLSGLQKEIFDLFVDLARKNGSQETGRVAVKTLPEQLACPLKSLPKTIQRLEKKGLIARKTVKSGPGGWTVYQMGSAEK